MDGVEKPIKEKTHKPTLPINHSPNKKTHQRRCGGKVEKSVWKATPESVGEKKNGDEPE